MLRLSLQSPDHQSGDTHMMLMLQSIQQVFRGLIRPGDVTLSDQSVMEKISCKFDIPGANLINLLGAYLGA